MEVITSSLAEPEVQAHVRSCVGVSASVVGWLLPNGEDKEMLARS